MGHVGGWAWVGSDGFVAARLVQIGDGSVEEERRVCGGRKKRWRGHEEKDMKKGEWNAGRIKNIKSSVNVK